RTCCCSTNRPTTWMPNPCIGWSSSCRTSRVPWWPLPTTVTFWITPPAGFWSWTAATAFPMKATTPAGLSRNRPVWSRRPGLRQDRRVQEARAEAAHQKALKTELEWVRQTPKGRQAKSKARLARFDELQSQEFQARNETNEIYIPPGERLGDKVIELENVSKGYGDRLLIDNLTLSIPKGAVVGIVGGNGAGKSTLFRMIAGTE